MKQPNLSYTLLLMLWSAMAFAQERQVLKNVLENGMAQDGTDQSDELTSLFADNTHLFFPNGKYHFTETMHIGHLENFTLEGEPETEFITDKPILLRVDGPLKKGALRNISIRSTDTTASSVGQLSLIHSDEQNITDLTFEDVFMTAPKSATNGIKFINERNTKTRGVVLRRVKVDSIGRMGFEIQNHHRQAKAAEEVRYEDILVVDSEFKNTGLREYGMGVSVGGSGKNVRVSHSDFTDCPDRAVEFIGTDGVVVEGNCFQDNFASIVVTRNEIVTGRPTTNVVFSNNVIDNSEGESFIAVENLVMDGNTLRIRGRLKFEDVKYAKVKALTIDTDAYAALVVGGLEEFVIHDSAIRNRRAGNNLIRIEGKSSNFKISKTDLFPAKGQRPYDDVGATNSIPRFEDVRVFDLQGNLYKTLDMHN